MDKKVFLLYLAKQDSPSQAYAELELPATPWQLLDALDQVRLQASEKLYMEVTDYYDFEYLAPYLDDIAPSLNELNALATQLTRLEGSEPTAFNGLLQSKLAQLPKNISMQDLRNMAVSVDCCRVVEEALNDSQLGRFYAENGFIPEVENLPDKVFELLDFELLGRRARKNEHGVFTKHGYVLQGTELKQAPPVPKEPLHPGYAILMELSKGYFNTPEADNDHAVLLELPSDPKTMDQRLDALDAASWDEVSWRCVDCKVPSLIEAVSQANSFAHVNRLAEFLTRMNSSELSQYKAILSATKCSDIMTATELISQAEEYVVDLNTASPVDVAEGELRTLLSSEAAELIRPHLNLHKYGESLIQRYHSTITEYGLVEQRDGQPIQIPGYSPQIRGMEMK